MRLRSSRSRGKSALAVIGSCLAVYAVFAVVFHSFIEPTVKTQAVAPYELSLILGVRCLLGGIAACYATPAGRETSGRL